MNRKVIAEFLEKYDFWYYNDKKNIEETIAKDNLLVSEFLERYSLDKLKNMSIEDYSIGIPGKEGFCRWVEQKLSDVGDIRGGQLTANQRFGIYFDDETNQYIFKRANDYKSKFGTEANEVFLNIKNELITLVKGIIEGEPNIVEKSRLNPLFKNKISYLYNQNNEVPIYGESDIDKLLVVFKIPFDIKMPRYNKRRLLFDFYQSLGRNDMSPLHFEHFIYNNLGYRSILRNEVELHLKKKEVKEYKLIDVNTVKKVEKKNVTRKSGLVKESYETYNQKQLTGKKGQLIVKEYLLNHKKELDIIGEIDCPCEYNDFAHYDISYTNSKGEKIYIEVKSSKNDTKDKVVFDMSAAERDFMIDNINNYYIFYIDNVYSNKIIKRISAKLVILEISKYHATFEVE